MPFGVNLMRSQVLYRAAQVAHAQLKYTQSPSIHKQATIRGLAFHLYVAAENRLTQEQVSKHDD